MKYKITANLGILDTYLTGGQIDSSGNFSEAFDVDLESDEMENLEMIIKAIKGDIKTSMELDETFEFYGNHYKFKMPCEKNLQILAKRIFKRIENEND